MNNSRSHALFQQARVSIPGGVNSPVRAFKSVGADPLFIKKASGSHIYDEDGNDFVDYVGSWGPMILGHGHPEVCLLYTSPSPRDRTRSRMPSSA